MVGLSPSFHAVGDRTTVKMEGKIAFLHGEEDRAHLLWGCYDESELEYCHYNSKVNNAP